MIQVREIIKEVSLKLARDELENNGGEERTEVFPTNRTPVVTSNLEELTFENAKFGFEKWDGKGVIINARAETVSEKPMFKKHVTTGRCVIPAPGYFEWKNPEEGQKKKIKHLIKDKHGDLLFMAGLWREGKEGREFVIITKDPFGDITGIHDRMPVMLKTNQLEAWLNGAMPIEALASLDYECIGEPCEEPALAKKESEPEQMNLLDAE